MKRPTFCRSAALAGVLLALGGAASFAQDVDSLLGKRVADLKIVSEGQDLHDAQVESLVEIRKGQPLTMALVRETITHVMSMGRFLDVEVHASPAGDGVAVVIEVVPLSDVRRLIFRGDLGLSEGALREAVTSRFGPTPGVGRATDIARTLEERLADDGYLRASVRPRPLAGADRAVGDLVFEVACGVQARVSTLNYGGSPPDVVADLRGRLPLHPGAAYEPADLRKRLTAFSDTLRGGGYFEARAEAYPRVSDDGALVDLLIEVTRGPLVTVEFAGDPLPPKERDGLVPFAREGSADEDLIEDAELRIRDYLRGQGYRDATARPSRTEENGRLRIVFTLRRGRLYRVASRLISGTAAVPEAELAPLTHLAEGQPFVQATLDADIAAIKDEYRRRGFVDATVTSSLVPVPGASTASEILVAVVLAVVEGARTIVQGVPLVGNVAIPEAQLRKVLKTRVGEPLVAPAIDADRDRLLVEYLNRGHRLATVEASITFADDRAAATVQFAIREGPQILVDHILVVGNSRISEATIREAVTLEPGQPLALDRINESQRRLSALGLFRRVTISEVQHGAEHARDVLIRVEEAPATSVGYGGGVELQKVETYEFAPRGFFEIGRRNLWGKNRSVNFFSRVSLRRRSDTTVSAAEPTPVDGSQTDVEYRVIGSYREPRAFGTSADLQMALAFEQGSRTSYSYRHRSARVDLAKRYQKFWSVLGQYSIQRNDILEFRVAPASIPDIDRLFPQVRIGSVAASGVRDTRDDPIDAGSGTLLGINGELALRPLGSEVGFAKTFLQGFIYRKLPGARRIVLAGGVRLGLGTGFPRSVDAVDDEGNPILGPDGQPLTEEVRDLPASERFFAGGDTTVRGFQTDRLGRPDTFDPYGTPIGGHAELIVNGEVRLALWRDLGVVGFLDAGNVFKYVNDVNLGHLRAGAGVGIRYKSPFGPFRVDFGFKLGTLRLVGVEREHRFAFHISIGQAF